MRALVARNLEARGITMHPWTTINEVPHICKFNFSISSDHKKNQEKEIQWKKFAKLPTLGIMRCIYTLCLIFKLMTYLFVPIVTQFIGGSAC